MSNHNTPKPILRDAMLALHAVLSGIESDIAEEQNVVSSTAYLGRHAIATQVIPMWERQHDKLAQFFDWNVYLDRAEAA